MSIRKTTSCPRATFAFCSHREKLPRQGGLPGVVQRAGGGGGGGGRLLRFAVIRGHADFQGRLFDQKYFTQGANLGFN